VTAAASTAPLIRVRGLSKAYGRGDARQLVLRDVDLDVAAGEFVAVTGASGSGKSTLLHLLGLLDTPSAGSYQLDGHDVSRQSDRRLARFRNDSIGFVFQAFFLLPRLNVLQNVLLPATYAHTRVPQERARELIDQVGLHGKERSLPNQLSGGQQQRVAIARALLMEPKLILADEPTGNLDSRTGAEIVALLKKVNAAGNTIVMVTHEADVAAAAGRAIRMRDGRIEA